MIKITEDHIKWLAAQYGYDYPAVKAIIEVESGGIGFAPDGKLIIQFEPVWFKRKTHYAPSGLWSVNGIERQSKEWEAFNSAFAIDANAAMESTSIGMMQIMGLHWKELGFDNVGEMWDFAKISEANQLELALKFIQYNEKLEYGLLTKNWQAVAYYYNGAKYKMNNYDVKLENAYKKYV